MRRRPAVIAYDIADNKRRRRIHRCHQLWQLDSQYSVFECRWHINEAEELLLQLCDMMDEQKDKLLFT
jgi:CRISPR-associated protein Cas2